MHRRTPRCSCPILGSSSTSTTAPRSRVTPVPSPSPALRPWNGRPSCHVDEPLVVRQVGGPFPAPASVRSTVSGCGLWRAADSQLLGVPAIAAQAGHVWAERPSLIELSGIPHRSCRRASRHCPRRLTATSSPLSMSWPREIRCELPMSDWLSTSRPGQSWELLRSTVRGLVCGSAISIHDVYGILRLAT
jgi:hypothetical protein